MTRHSTKQIPEACQPRALQRETRRVLKAVVTLLAAWDADVFAHSQAVARAVLSLAPADCTAEWYWAGLLHDVGKIALPGQILRKRGALTPVEWKTMQQHSVRGANLLKQIGAPPTIVLGAKFHHERWDGTGYPCDRRGRQIPLVARALAIADVYTALTSDRPYRRAYLREQARLEIEREAGSQFDESLVAQFFSGD